MAGLVSYGSSDGEDDRVEQEPQSLRPHAGKTPALAEASANGVKDVRPSNGERSLVRQTEQSSTAIEHNKEPLVGPVLGPSIPVDITMISDPLEDQQELTPTPQSPYSANRALLRDLTLPNVPNYDIPLSPPGPPVASTNAKFKHFLDLKRQGVHFNEKLAKSAALKNPSLIQKLIDFAGIDEAEMYSTTLPQEFWNPNAFPESAYKDELARSQQQILKKREEQKLKVQRDAVDFVPASTAAETSSRGGTPGGAPRGPQRSAAERVMVGLERGRSNSPQVQGVKRKTRFES